MTQTTASVRVAAFARAALVAAVVVILDQVTKSLVRSDIPVGDRHKFVPGIITFVHDRNTGVAFTLFAGGGALVLVVTFAALALLIGYFAMHPGRALLWLPTGMLVGGAIGNLIDRIARGAVTDFIQLPHWPAFNVADMSITFGVLTLLWVLEGPRAKG
jgi:signal peptidase II